MADRSPHDIEQEIEHERAELTRTIDQLQARFSPDHMIREATDSIKEHGGEIGRAVTKQVKENPLAVALVGAGLAWMVLGNKRKSHDDDTPRLAAPRRARAHDDGFDQSPAHVRRAGLEHYRNEDLDWLNDLDDDDDENFADRAAHAAEDAKDAAGSTVAKVRDRVSSVASSAAAKADRLRRKFAHGTEGMTEAARDRVVAARQKAWIATANARATAKDGLRKGRDGAVDFFEEQPLVAGALALAAGAAVAAALPRTRKEDEWLGETSDRLVGEAQRVFREEAEKARAVATATGEAARKLAEEKVDEVKKVAKGAANGLDDVARKAVKAASSEAKEAGKELEQTARKEAEKQNLGKSDA